MIYSDRDLEEALATGVLRVEPYDETAVQPSSLDLHLDRYFTVFNAPLSPEPIDPFMPLPEDYETKVESDTFVIGPGQFVLASTTEWLWLDTKVAGRVEGKSSLARLGLIIHTTAGFIDPGFSGYVTLELVNVSPRPMLLTAGMPIAQLALFECKNQARQTYDDMGKYGHAQRGPTSSRYSKNPYPLTPPPRQ